MKERSLNRKQADSVTSQSSQLQSRVDTAQGQLHSQKPLTQAEVENQEFQQHKIEATKLRIQAKYNSLTPEGEKRLTVLQAKMDGLLHTREENASQFGHSLSTISVNRPEISSVQMQPATIKDKLPISEPLIQPSLQQKPESIHRMPSATEKKQDGQTTEAASTSKQADAENKSVDRKQKFLNDYSVARDLVNNIDETLAPDKILEQLFKNFEKIDFTYTMVNKSHETLLKGTKEGDCQTLARAFKAIAEECFGITNITINQIKEPFLSEAGKTPHKGKEFNCEFENGKKGWFFQNHYWATWNNKIYDVLFLSHNRTEVDKARQTQPLKSMFMPEEEYYETEKGKIVYPIGKGYSTAPLSLFDKAKNFVKNLGNGLYRDTGKIINSIRSFFTSGARNDSGLDSLLGELKKDENTTSG